MHALMLWAVLTSAPVGKEAPGSASPPAQQTATAGVAEPDAAEPDAAGPADQQKPPREPDVLTRESVEALRESGRRADAEAAETVPVLAGLYVEIGRCEAMPRAERRRLQSRLAIRLSEIRGDLIRQVLAERAAERRRSPSPRDSARSNDANQSAGGGSNAIELIDLIQTTIAPESWQRAGGPGSIYFYRPLNVMVIRQTGEVHHQVGGLLDALRK